MLGTRCVLKVWGGYDGMDLGYKREGMYVGWGVVYDRAVHGECTLGI